MTHADTQNVMPPTTPETEERGGCSRAASCSASGRTHLDLFSGIGGFALAAQAAGYSTIGFSEIEPYACKILKRHWPAVPNYGDIRNVRGVRADLITGGFPCQPFSLAGKRLGAADDRHRWPEMCRVVGEARPTWVLGENVPGIVKVALDQVCTDLEALGYTVQPVALPACAVDAPHQRQRVWILAHARRIGRERGRGECGRSEEAGPCDRTSRSGEHTEYVADARSERLEGLGSERRPSGSTGLCGGERENQDKGILADANSEPARWASKPRCERRQWEPEPDVGRVAHGIPHRVDRLRGLGNAIVPQIAEWLGRQILATTTPAQPGVGGGA